MTAKPRDWWGPDMDDDQTLSKIFTAKFPGSCARCGTPFDAGADVFYVGGDLYASDGCEDITEESIGAEFDSFTRGRTPGIAVMPRGKTKRDRCDKCFMIHASGQVECE